MDTTKLKSISDYAKEKKVNYVKVQRAVNSGKIIPTIIGGKKLIDTSVYGNFDFLPLKSGRPRADKEAILKKINVLVKQVEALK
jgi:hypothetical protein